VLLRSEEGAGTVDRREHDCRRSPRTTDALAPFDEAFYVLDGELPFNLTIK
jgi:hypothetical protein